MKVSRYMLQLGYEVMFKQVFIVFRCKYVVGLFLRGSGTLRVLSEICDWVRFIW